MLITESHCWSWIGYSCRSFLRIRVGGLSHPSSLPLFLFPKNSPTHFQHRFEALSTSSSILAKSLNAGFFDLGPDFLPPAAQGCDFSVLGKLRSLVPWRRSCEIGLIGHGFPYAEDIGPGQVRGAHSHALFRGGYVRGFINV